MIDVQFCKKRTLTNQCPDERNSTVLWLLTETEFKWSIYCLWSNIILVPWKSSEIFVYICVCVCMCAHVCVSIQSRDTVLYLSLPANHLPTLPVLLYLSLLFSVFNTRFPCNRREYKPEPRGNWPFCVVFHRCWGLAETGTFEGKDYLKGTVGPRGGKSVL